MITTEDVIPCLDQFENAAESYGWTNETKLQRIKSYSQDSAEDWYMFYVTFGGDNKPQTFTELSDLLK